MIRWVPRILAGATVVIGATLLWSTAARPQARFCAPLAAAERSLITEYGEVLVAVGLLQENMVKIFVSPTTGSWTILQVDANRIACIEAAGKHMEFIVPETPGDPS